MGVTTKTDEHRSVQLPEGTAVTSGLDASTLELCQLRWMDDALAPLNRLERAMRFINAKRLGLRRRTIAALSRVTPVEPEPYGGRAKWIVHPDRTSVPLPPRKVIVTGLKPGDLVEVRSVEEIRSTLNPEGKTGGLKFLRPMEDYCGRRMRVLKPVRRILDEHHHVMQKISRTVVLEGGICHGRGIYGREGCDRCCYFFWKEDWLRKIEE